ncbi:transcriptional protein SWT1 [Megalops cyprinoides]|uniref:transcriptional protein SWT1 n=1 Tax=Megalops cyprinoides TaxID=118141 RepID=UPI0018642F5F|nr:transcriptional protein SWT1 [Megalops cyprinoides]
MSKKAKKKKQKRERKGSSSSAREDDDKLCHEKDCKRRKTSDEKHSSISNVRSMHDEERKRKMVSSPSPKKDTSESSSGKDRQYKKAVYRLSTVIPSDNDRDHRKDVGEKPSKSSSASIHVSASKTSHCYARSPLKPASGGASLRTGLSQELQEKRRQLVKRRSREVESYSPSQGKSTHERSSDPRKPPAALEKASTSDTNISISKAVTQGRSGHAESSKPSGSSQEEKPHSKPRERFSFKISKKTNLVTNRSELWEGSSRRDGKAGITRRLSGSGQRPRVENVVSEYTFPDKKTAEQARQSSKRNPTATHHARVISPPTERLQEAKEVCPGVDNHGRTDSNIITSSKETVTSRVFSEATETGDNDQEMQLMEELHLARSQRRLEVNVVESYGELTCMDIDPPENITTLSFSKGHQDILIILDTNILLSHLDFVKRMRSHGLGALGFPIILIPWVVMQELDALKSGKLSSDVVHKARPAVHFIYTSLKNQEPRLWGQSMQQAARGFCGLNAESNDDRVLQCCLQYQGLYPGVTLILCTNDKNLCSKALLSGVKAVSKADLVSEVARLESQPNTHQAFPLSVLPQPAEDGKATGTENESENERRLAAAEPCEVSASVSILEGALQGALSRVLEAEMKAAFGDLWQEVVFVKPPWALNDLLLCFKKHWIAVFGNVIQRGLLNSVEYLSESLCKGKTMDRFSTKLAVRQARELLLAFSHRSDYGGHLTKSLSALELLLQEAPQETSGDHALASSDGDILMAVEEGVTDPQRLYQEVWAVFENIWNNVCQARSTVFAALQFIPDVLESGLPSEGPPPSEEALSYLQKLTTVVRQLVESIQRVLSSSSCSEDVQSLLTFINTSEIATMKPSFTAKDLFDCLSQQEYREKLRVGGSQLVDLSLSLERCASAAASRAGSSSWP